VKAFQRFITCIACMPATLACNAYNTHLQCRQCLFAMPV
jgi:hypothetical protein